MTDAPERIFLQDAGDYASAAAFEVTWCVEPQNDADTEYIRADKVAALVEALDGIRSSWADGIVKADGQHTLILEDGSRHTGPSVDFLARLANAQTDLIVAALAAFKGDAQ